MVKEFSQLLGFVRPYWRRMFLALAAALLSSLLSLALPLVVQQLIDSVLLNRDLARLNWLVGGLAVVFAIQGALSFGQTYLLSYVGERVVVDLRSRLYRHLHHLPLSYHLRQPVGSS